MRVSYATNPDIGCHKPVAGDIPQLCRGENATYYDMSRQVMLTPGTRLFQRSFAAQIRAIYKIKKVLPIASRLTQSLELPLTRSLLCEQDSWNQNI